jgi:hypothetical protein
MECSLDRLQQRILVEQFEVHCHAVPRVINIRSRHLGSVSFTSNYS